MMNRILVPTVLFLSVGAAPAHAQPVVVPMPPDAAIAAIAAEATQAVKAATAAQPTIAAMKLAAAAAWTSDDRADDLYEHAREAIEEGHYDRALADLDRLLAMNSNRTDAALYWKAYSQGKLGRRADALTTLADFQKRFTDSRWLRDVKALDVELRQASGQKVSPDSENDDELKLMALRGLMNSDPDQALPVISKMLTGANSPKVKDRALFVLSQSHSAKAREIITGVAKGNGNPDLQLKAIRYLGIMGDADNRQVLVDVYRTANDVSVKRAILRSYMQSGDRERLMALAKSEADASLRGDAVQQLGIIHATTELSQLYGSETAVEIKKRILQAMFVSGESDKLIELAKGEKDAELRKTAIHNLGLMKRPGTSEALTSIYASDATPDVRRAVVNALFLQNNAAALVSLARAEKNPEMKKEIVSKLSIMKSKEATDYLLELLK
jgi:tetratricopeptide (TPR) repeat protein